MPHREVLRLRFSMFADTARVTNVRIIIIIVDPDGRFSRMRQGCANVLSLEGTLAPPGKYD